jgi:hypothetical protein
VKDVTSHLPIPLQAHDQCLMDTVTMLPALTPKMLETFNLVHLYLGVAFLSKISSADGRHLSRDAWQGSCPRHTPLLWPYQAAPSQPSFQVWQRLLATALLSDHRSCVEFWTKDLLLALPLGHWHQSSGWLRTKWSSFFAPSTQMLYIFSLPSQEAQQSHQEPSLPSRAIHVGLFPPTGHYPRQPRHPVTLPSCKLLSPNCPTSRDPIQ